MKELPLMYLLNNGSVYCQQTQHSLLVSGLLSVLRCNWCRKVGLLLLGDNSESNTSGLCVALHTLAHTLHASRLVIPFGVLMFLSYAEQLLGIHGKPWWLWSICQLLSCSSYAQGDKACTMWLLMIASDLIWKPQNEHLMSLITSFLPGDLACVRYYSRHLGRPHNVDD